MTEAERDPLLVPRIREADFAVRRPWVVAERILSDFLLVHVQEGRCLFTVNGEETEYTAGDFCLIQPGDRLELRGITNTVTPFAHLDLFVSERSDRSWVSPVPPGPFPPVPPSTQASWPRPAQPRLTTVGVQMPTKFQPTDPQHFRLTMHRMISVWQSGDFASRLEAQQLATELVVALVRQFGKVRSWEAHSAHTLEWLAAYLSFRLSDPLSVEDMARRAHLSPSQFTRVFRENFGTTPYRYLLDLRVHQVRQLLVNTKLPHKKIAEYCGFADEHHLSKVFKRVTGQSPGAYRRGAGDSQRVSAPEAGGAPKAGGALTPA